MKRHLSIAKRASLVGLTATVLLLLTTIFATGAMSQEREEYSIIRLHGLGYFEPIDRDKESPVDEVNEPSLDSEPDEPSLDSEPDEPSLDSEPDELSLDNEPDEPSADSEAVKPTPVGEATTPKLALDMKLRATTPTTCIDSSIWLEVDITNTGKLPIKIGKHEVWAYIIHRHLIESVEAVDGETYYGGGSSNYFVLAVGESYRGTYEFSLRDTSFFEQEGKYALRTRIGSAQSNEVTFELCDCGNTIEEVN